MLEGEFIQLITKLSSLLSFRQLSGGTLEGNFLVDGSRVTLLPRAETGLLVRHDSRKKGFIFVKFYSVTFALMDCPERGRRGRVV